MLRYPFRWPAVSLPRALGRAALPRGRALARCCTLVAGAAALAAGCGLLVAATVVGVAVVRSTSGGAAAALLTGSAMFVRVPAAVVDVAMLPCACSSTAAVAVAVTTATVVFVSAGGRLFALATATVLLVGTGGGCITASVRVAGVMKPMSIIGLSRCSDVAATGVDIVGSALTSGESDVILADGVDGSLFTLLGENGVLFADTNTIFTSSSSSMSMTAGVAAACSAAATAVAADGAIVWAALSNPATSDVSAVGVAVAPAGAT